MTARGLNLTLNSFFLVFWLLQPTYLSLSLYIYNYIYKYRYTDGIYIYMCVCIMYICIYVYILMYIQCTYNVYIMYIMYLYIYDGIAGIAQILWGIHQPSGLCPQLNPLPRKNIPFAPRLWPSTSLKSHGDPLGGRRVGTCQVIVQVPHCFLVFFSMCFLLLLNLGHIHTLGKAREARDED